MKKNYRYLAASGLLLMVLSLFLGLGTWENIKNNNETKANVSSAGILSQALATMSAGQAAPTAGQESQAPVVTTPAAQPTATATPAPPAPTPYPAPALTIPQVGNPAPFEFSGQGQVTQRQFFSTLLNKNMPYLVYLPKGYDSSRQRYPVLYMLHGFSGQAVEWTWYGLFEQADNLIKSGAIKPLIIVLPTGEQEYWMDHPDNGAPWAKYMATEVVDHIDGNFRTIPLPESRAIGGLSMGANGALQVSMNYPNIFGVVGAHSPTMRTYEQKLPWWGDQAWFAQNDPITLAKTSAYISQVKLWIDIGTEDQTWRPRALELKKVLQDRAINFKWADYPGDHNADYWRAHAGDYLKWYGSSLDYQSVT